ncbi:unnamed protein product, partial [Symbiodinium sp. KB8]
HPLRRVQQDLGHRQHLPLRQGKVLQRSGQGAQDQRILDLHGCSSSAKLTRLGARVPLCDGHSDVRPL